MKNTMINNIKEGIKVSVIALAITLGVTYAYAVWTGPTVAPPDGNVDAPINVGEIDQIKDGGLGVETLAVFGNSAVSGYMKVGFSSVSCTTSLEGSLRFDSATQTLQLCSDLIWKDLGQAAPTQFLIGGRSAQGCVDLGGSLFDVGNGYICKFTAASCPGGWGQYQNWSNTSSRTCIDSAPDCGIYGTYMSGGYGCTTGNHPTFSNIAIETCIYGGHNPNDPSNPNLCYASTCVAYVNEIGCY